MFGAQLAKSTAIENTIAYYIANDPSPILWCLPTDSLAKAFSTDRLDPMVRDCPVLGERIGAKRSRDSGNTLLQKRFAGGHLTLTGANSPSALRGRPIRVLLLDEVDAYPISAGKEGDPVNLAVARTSNFWNRKVILTSTPTVKDLSRIEREFELSDRRYYHIPCPHCEELDKLTWERIKWDNHDPKTAHCVCLKCGAVIEEHEKMAMLRGGVWIKDNPESAIAGFHLSALYSPWRTWAELVTVWLESKGNRESLKVFLNTILAESWDDTGERVEIQHLASRLEDWKKGTVPDGVGVLVAAVDVQESWLECHVWGYGAKEESWFIDRVQIFEDPGTESAWENLRLSLGRKYQNAHGADIGIRAVACDTGHQTERVMRFVGKMRKRFGAHIIPVKGSSLPDAKLLTKTKTIFSVGGNTAKDLIHSRMKQVEHGPGFIHLPKWIDLDILDQLVSERRVTKYKAGRAYRVWENTKRERNEALDCMVYSMAALHSLGTNIVPFLGQLAEKVAAKRPTTGDGEPETPSAEPETIPVANPHPVRAAVRQQLRQRQPQRGGWKSGFHV